MCSLTIKEDENEKLCSSDGRTLDDLLCLTANIRTCRYSGPIPQWRSHGMTLHRGNPSALPLPSLVLVPYKERNSNMQTSTATGADVAIHRELLSADGEDSPPSNAMTEGLDSYKTAGGRPLRTCLWHPNFPLVPSICSSIFSHFFTCHQKPDSISAIMAPKVSKAFLLAVVFHAIRTTTQPIARSESLSDAKALIAELKLEPTRYDRFHDILTSDGQTLLTGQELADATIFDFNAAFPVPGGEGGTVSTVRTNSAPPI